MSGTLPPIPLHLYGVDLKHRDSFFNSSMLR